MSEVVSDTVGASKSDLSVAQITADCSWKGSTSSSLQSTQSPFNKFPATPPLIDDSFMAPQPESATSSLGSVLTKSQQSWSGSSPIKPQDTKEILAVDFARLYQKEHSTTYEGEAIELLGEFDKTMCRKLPSILTPLPLGKESSKDDSRVPLMAKAIFSRSQFSAVCSSDISTSNVCAHLQGSMALPCPELAQSPNSVHKSTLKVQYDGFVSFQTDVQSSNEPDTIVLVPGKRPTLKGR